MNMKSSKVLTTVVSRKKWLRGEQRKGCYSYLRRKGDKKQCCLGFRARVGGAKACEIEGRWSPEQVKSGPFFTAKFVEDYKDTQLAKDMMNVNDDEDMTDRVREARLKKLFKKAGERIRFVD